MNKKQKFVNKTNNLNFNKQIMYKKLRKKKNYYLKLFNLFSKDPHPDLQQC